MSRTLRLTIKEPGTLFSQLLEREITMEQLVQIERVLDPLEEYLLVPKSSLMGAMSQRRIGFGRPEEETRAKS